VGRHPNTCTIDLSAMFLQVQQEMLSHLAAGELFEHPTAAGAVTEHHWLALFNSYLPQRYRAASAFIVDADGDRSRQIDIAIYDNLYSPLLFPDAAGLHIPTESVYAVFEVKQDLNQRLIYDAGLKAASVRRLRRTSVPVLSAGRRRAAVRCRSILARILALRSGWPTKFAKRLPDALALLAPDERLDLGCALRDGAFECTPPCLHALHFRGVPDLPHAPPPRPPPRPRHRPRRRPQGLRPHPPILQEVGQASACPNLARRCLKIAPGYPSRIDFAVLPRQ